MINAYKKILLAIGAPLVIVSAMAIKATVERDDNEETMNQFDTAIQVYEITEGSFGSLTIGQLKDDVLETLRALNVESVRPDLKDRPVATQPEQLESLRSAEGVIIGAGSVVVEFDGNRVTYILVAPIYPRWREILQGAESRDEIFEGLERIFATSNNVVVRAIAPDTDNVLISALTERDKDLLYRYDSWRVAYEDDEGYWNLELIFESGNLIRIAVWHSPSGPL